MTYFNYFAGMITMIHDFWTGAEEENGCYKRMTLVDDNGRIVNFVVSPSTYFVDHALVTIGDSVIGFYDALAPVPLIYPPQYQAIVMAKTYPPYKNVKVDFFNDQLISYDGILQLNIGPSTQIILENGQLFTGNIENRNLVVVYGPTTRSIPAQTTPYKVIVLCG